MRMLEYSLSCRKMIFSQEIVKKFVGNINQYWMRNSWKFCHEVVCNVHHINEPLVAYVHLN